MCKPILKGQNVPGTDGTYHGTDGPCPRDRRDAHQGVSRQNSLCLLVFFFPHVTSGKSTEVFPFPESSMALKTFAKVPSARTLPCAIGLAVTSWWKVPVRTLMQQRWASKLSNWADPGALWKKGPQSNQSYERENPPNRTF